MDKIKILHTADIHMGAPFEFLGERGGEQRRAIREVFSRITALAAADYDLLLVAGDLFDDGFNVAEKDLLAAVEALSSLGSGCRAVILPGSHDYWTAGSVYERDAKRLEGAGKVNILTPDNNLLTIPELSLTVHGGVLTSNATSRNLLADLIPDPEVSWNVAVLHGSVSGASAAQEEENPIELGEMRKGFDYLALGHWHSFNQIRDSGPPVIYSGAPELINRDQAGAGSVVSVELSRAGVRARKIAVGRRRIERIALECGGIGSTEELTARIKERVGKDRDLVLEISLSGIIGAEAVMDLSLAEELLSERYFSVRFAGKGPAREISAEELSQVPPDTVAGKYIKLLLERIGQAPEQEKEKLEEALQLGYHLFRGRNPLG
ncbi:MAG: DNA repair exonuclease [Candidatus Krumholzibacteriota bacterium]|nr:DNA repair exonuclease [Candidatus Krumholzibacteriota bacterium]